MQSCAVSPNWLSSPDQRFGEGQVSESGGVLDRLDAIMNELFELATDDTAPALVRRIATYGADALLVGPEVERDRLTNETTPAELQPSLH